MLVGGAVMVAMVVGLHLVPRARVPTAYCAVYLRSTYAHTNVRQRFNVPFGTDGILVIEDGQ